MKSSTRCADLRTVALNRRLRKRRKLAAFQKAFDKLRDPVSSIKCRRARQEAISFHGQRYIADSESCRSL